MKETVSFSGQVRPQDVRPQPYIYLPFAVPPRTTRIDVSYNYDDPVMGDFGQGAGNTVDIGIFDPRGLEFLEGSGFRGWSGSRRRQFFLSPNQASPGYIAGPILPGQWHIVLGFESIMERGCRYDVRVDLTVGEEPEQDAQDMIASSVVTAPAPTKRGRSDHSGWYKGDLHCHTIHSDGLNSVEEIARGAIERGLDFLAVTDHNTSSHHQELARLNDLDIVLIPGEEITTYWGHANVFGLRDWIDFRCTNAEAMQAVARFVLAKGGLISVNHPKAVGPAWLFDEGDGYPCMEVWQAPWRWFNWESLERWDRLLQQGRHIVAVGGSDTHSIPPARPMHFHGLGDPTTWVYAPGPLSESATLDAIRLGHAFISQDASGPQLYLTADADGDGRYETMMGDAISAREDERLAFRVRCLGAAGRKLWLVSQGVILNIVPVEGEDFVHDFSLELRGQRYLRAELRGYRGRPERGEVVVAMTNPIYLVTGS
ncbi:MAG: CehA/McbA family metallohydrolase [Dehalococcoidia bacterium]